MCRAHVLIQENKQDKSFYSHLSTQIKVNCKLIIPVPRRPTSPRVRWWDGQPLTPRVLTTKLLEFSTPFAQD